MALSKVGGYFIHNYLTKQSDIEVTSMSIDGICGFEVRCHASFQANDYVLKWSADGKKKTLWRVTSCSSLKYNKFMGSMVNLAASEMPSQFLRAMRLAEKNTQEPTKVIKMVSSLKERKNDA